MADFKDTMAVRKDTDEAVSALDNYAAAIECNERQADQALATLLGASAICKAIREVSVTIDYIESMRGL